MITQRQVQKLITLKAKMPYCKQVEHYFDSNENEDKASEGLTSVCDAVQGKGF